MTTTDEATRRQMLRAGVVAVGGVVATVAGARAQGRLAQENLAQQKFAQDKIAQNQVQYQKSPKDGNKCNMCVNWEAPSSCKIVAGTIDPNGWCIAYAPKES